MVYEKALLRLLVGHDRRVGMLGREVDRRAVAPAADDLGREQFLTAGIELRRLRELGPEGGHVLVELSVDEEGAVRRELVGRGRVGQHVLLVGIAQDELAGTKRPPVAAAQRRAAAGLRRQAGTLDVRLGEPVGVTEVLAGNRA